MILLPLFKFVEAILKII